MNKKSITLGFLFLLIVTGGKYSIDNYSQYRNDRYQACNTRKAKIIHDHEKRETIKAKIEAGHYDGLSLEKRAELVVKGEELRHNSHLPLPNPNKPQKKETKQSDLFSDYSDTTPAIVAYNKNNDRPCVWLDSYSQLRERTSVGSASY